MAKRIGFLGPAGTYTEEATLQYDSQAELLPFLSIAAIGQAVTAGVTDQGVVPIENSLEGSVTFTLDHLISQPGLSIRDEIVLPNEHFCWPFQVPSFQTSKSYIPILKPWPSAAIFWKGASRWPSRVPL